MGASTRMPPIAATSTEGPSRRQWLLLLASCGLAVSGTASALAAEPAPTLADALRAIGSVPAPPGLLRLSMATQIDNGAVVPVTIESRLPDTTEIQLVVESNPIPMAVRFEFADGAEPYVGTRIKIAESGVVHAIARAGGRLYSVSLQTQVAVGGCG